MFVRIVEATRAWFIARGFTDVSVDAGIEARNAQTNYGAGSANRVVFVPAKDPIQIIAPTRIGEDDDGHRQLYNTLFVYEVCFAGFDDSKPEDELAHRAQCYALWEITAQAVQRAYSGENPWASARWEDSRKHGRHGCELIATLVLNIPLFDVESVSATPAPVPGEPKPAT